MKTSLEIFRISEDINRGNMYRTLHTSNKRFVLLVQSNYFSYILLLFKIVKYGQSMKWFQLRGEINLSAKTTGLMYAIVSFLNALMEQCRAIEIARKHLSCNYIICAHRKTQIVLSRAAPLAALSKTYIIWRRRLYTYFAAEPLTILLPNVVCNPGACQNIR